MTFALVEAEKNTKTVVVQTSKTKGEIKGNMSYVYLQNIHTHSTFCDGNNTPEELVQQAISLGFNAIGFSGHSLQEFENKYSMTEQGTKEYVKEIKRLKEAYKDKIDIFLGIEYDYYSVGSLKEYDYVIGSVHYIKVGEGEYRAIDTRNPNVLEDLIEKYFDGNPMLLVKEYFRLLGEIPNRLGRAGVIGHFDLLLKSSEIKKIFNTESVEYREYATECIKKLIDSGCLFEINTGAVARGLRCQPYPEQWALEKMQQLGAKVIISSDCHYQEKLNFYFKEAIEYIKECGFKEVYTLTKNGFVANKI